MHDENFENEYDFIKSLFSNKKDEEDDDVLIEKVLKGQKYSDDEDDTIEVKKELMTVAKRKLNRKTTAKDNVRTMKKMSTRKRQPK